MAAEAASNGTKAKSSSPEKNDNKKKKDDEKKKKKVEYNPRWKGYMFIFLSSLINLSSSANVSRNYEYSGIWQLAVTFGSVTFAISFLIILFDRTKWMSDKLGDFTKASDGKLEGGLLVSSVIWWVVGVSYQTQVDGIAYLANNVYFSAWMSLASCIYTLNEWSTDKDILSIDEMTGISETLPGWYLLLFGSLVVTGTSIQLWVLVYEDFKSEAALGMALGLGSIVICVFWIFVHYNFIVIVNEGGWFEVNSSFVAILLWIVAVAVLTQEGAVAATLVGSGCRNSEGVSDALSEANKNNCTINYVDNQGQPVEQSCSSVLQKDVPGSNLYLSLWLCLGTSLNIAFKWKQQQAQNFAQAQNEKSAAGSKSDLGGNGDEEEGGDDDDDDLDDFQDADLY